MYSLFVRTCTIGAMSKNESENVDFMGLLKLSSRFFQFDMKMEKRG